MRPTQTVFDGKRVLLAEDETSVREAIRMLLECLGLHVTEASDGEEALGLYRREQFDYVVTDYRMPKMRGDELAREIKAINPQQRVVVVSGYVERILESGRPPSFIDVLVAKPCSLKQLADALV